MLLTAMSGLGRTRTLKAGLNEEHYLVRLYGEEGRKGGRKEGRKEGRKVGRQALTVHKALSLRDNDVYSHNCRSAGHVYSHVIPLRG